jgi:hypothetical protein
MIAADKNWFGGFDGSLDLPFDLLVEFFVYK